SNDQGEICPICLWEEEYLNPEDLLGFSSANHMTLYQAQTNYKKFGCCSDRLLKNSRKPLDEKKDGNWLSVQDIIENKYNTASQTISEIHRLSKLLREVGAQVTYDNFKTLNEIDIAYDYEELELNFIEFNE